MAKGRFLDVFVAPLQKLDPARALEKALVKNADAILDLNRQQLDRGLDAKGRSLGRYKRFSYKGRYQPVDLKLTGAWRRKFYLLVDNRKRQTLILSEDWKHDILEWMKGKAITGISQQMLENVRSIIHDDLQRAFKEQR
jgi:hypothetical protein